jgi:class 3 adenylate cyclase
LSTSVEDRFAWIVWVDVVRFSEREGQAQRAVMNALTTHLLEHPLLGREDRSERYYMNSTGDGYVVACFQAAYPQPSAIIAFAAGVASARWSTDDGASFEVRVALNYGQIGVPADGLPFPVGHAFNWARRLCDACAPRQVVASAEFVEAARAYEQSTAGHWTATEALEAKHGREILFSVLRGPDLSLEVSPRRAQALWAGERAAFILEALAEGLRGHDSSSSVRLTLWVLDGDGCLRSVAPRVVTHSADHASTRPGSTRYRVDSVVEGPVGAAFADARVIVRCSLPDPDIDAVGYGMVMFGPVPDALAGDLVARVGAMSRRPKSILAVPLQLLMAPAGVLCIDFGQNMAEERLSALGKEVFESAGPVLSALLHLRGLVA